MQFVVEKQNVKLDVVEEIIFQQFFLIKTYFSVIIYIYKKNVVFLDISNFDDLYTNSFEEFSIKEKLDSLLKIYSLISKMRK